MARYTIRACRVGYMEIEAESEQEAYDNASSCAVDYNWEDDVFNKEIIDD